MFVEILGAETGNMALKYFADGGVFIGGGIPPRILNHLQKGPLMKAFMNKGRFSKLMEIFPVTVLLNPYATVLGAAWHGLKMNNERRV
jgi:glucokinase